MTEKVLLPIDFSEEGKDVFRQVNVWREENDYEIHVLHVIREGSADGVRKKMQRYVKDLNLEIPCEFHVRSGKPYEQILEQCQEIQADQIFMTAHSHTLSQRLFVGSHTNYVLHHVNCPVYVYRSPGENEIRENRIMVPVGLTNISKKVVETAGEWARRDKAKVYIVTVIPNVFADNELYMDVKSPKVLSQEEKMAQAQLLRLARACVPKEVEFDAKVLVGKDIGVSLINYQQTIDPKVIVMAAHKYSKLERLFMGSTTDYLVRNTQTPMYVIKLKP